MSKLFVGGPPGFYNASVLKGFIVVSGACTFLSTWMKSSNLMNSPDLWKRFAHSLLFPVPSEFITGAILLYQLRMLERQQGSAKFAAFAIFSTIMTTLLQLTAFVVFKNTEVFPLSSILTNLAFATLVQYFLDVPVTQPLSVFGLNFSNKVFPYMVAVQLIFTNSGVSVSSRLIACLCGLLSGMIYRTDFGGIRNSKVSTRVSNFFSTYVESWLGSSDPRRTTTASARVHRRHLHAQNSGGLGSGSISRPNPRVVAPAPVAIPPSENNISLLEQMGFAHDDCVRALTQTNNDLARATNILLDSN